MHGCTWWEVTLARVHVVGGGTPLRGGGLEGGPQNVVYRLSFAWVGVTDNRPGW